MVNVDSQEDRLRRGRTRINWFKWILILGAALFVATMSICIMPAIWPGELKLTAPVFCSDAQLGGSYTPMVVTDTRQLDRGTGFSWTLYCVGPHGELKNAGYGLPIGVLFLAHLAIIALIIAVFMLRKRPWVIDLSRLRRRKPEPEPKPKRQYVFDNTPGGDDERGPGSGG